MNCPMRNSDCVAVRTRRRPARGFTIIELMLTMIIVGILVVIAGPALGEFISAVRLRTGASDLYAALVYARSEAIKRNANVTITPTSGDWAQGWTVNASGVTNALRTQEALKGIAAASGSAITYNGTGRVGGTATVNLKSSAHATIAMRCVVIDLTGRVTTKTDTNGNSSDGCN